MRKGTGRCFACSSLLSELLNEGKIMQAVGSDLDIMAVLKEATRERHEAVEKIMPFFEDDFSLEDYVSVLKTFLGFFEPIERELASITTWHLAGFDIERRLRSHLLRADLLALGVSDNEIARIPPCVDLPCLSTVDQGFGCLYVLEGSTLGGQVISRQVQSRIATSAETGGKFFHGYGNQTGLMWREFCSALREHSDTSQNRSAIITAAEDTFEKMESWMRKAYLNE